MQCKFCVFLRNIEKICMKKICSHLAKNADYAETLLTATSGQTVRSVQVSKEVHNVTCHTGVGNLMRRQQSLHVGRCPRHNQLCQV